MAMSNANKNFSKSSFGTMLLRCSVSCKAVHACNSRPISFAWIFVVPNELTSENIAFFHMQLAVHETNQKMNCGNCLDKSAKKKSADLILFLYLLLAQRTHVTIRDVVYGLHKKNREFLKERYKKKKKKEKGREKETKSER